MRFMLHLNKIIIFLAILTTPTGVAWGASVSEISGTISDGQSITITGLSFGANGPQVLLFDDFEGGTNGNSLSTETSVSVGEWDGIQASENTSYTNAYSISGDLSAQFDSYNYPVNTHPVIWTIL